ncbi:MAG: flagellar basal body P-ring protein FlgI [Phycisphaerales bacterium]|nr:flagellar basal body P-ring protein FlgI [Phycisphaerales bacterium]
MHNRGRCFAAGTDEGSAGTAGEGWSYCMSGARTRGVRRVETCLIVALCGLGGAALTLLGGCSDAPKEVTKVDPVIRDVPAPLRGTIGAEATIRGVQQQLVSGLGIVVGLNGTGGGELPAQVQATMERELGRQQFTKATEGITPKQFLRDPNVAVVIVEAAVAPGSPKGQNFDVRVRTLPGSAVTSLEGGQLWTTELRLGPVTSFGGAKTRILAEARGPIFINPFAEPGKGGEDAVSRTVGRVLAGGKVVEPLHLELVLDNSSHSRARSIVGAVNSRFPEGPTDEGPIAKGRSPESIAITVPRAYAKRPNEFIELLRCTRVDQAFPQEYAKRYVEELKRSPALAQDISWCLMALGKPAVPFLQDVYEHPEALPRMAALRAGGKLGDVRAVPHLKEMALRGPGLFRVEAITLLGEMPGHPTIDLALRELVNAPELDVRVGAYEALSRRGDVVVDRIPVGDIGAGRPAFLVETVPASEPMIYVTQQGEPRIVLFGGDGGLGGAEMSLASMGGARLQLERPLLVSAWSDRLMLTSEGSDAPVRVFYRDFRTQKVTQQTVKEDVAKLIEFMGHKPTPEDPRPGLGLAYSEVVGALYEIHRQGGVNAAFATEVDRLKAQLYKAAEETLAEERPESSDVSIDGPIIIFKPEEPGAEEKEAEGQPEGASMVVPLAPKVQKAK